MDINVPPLQAIVQFWAECPTHRTLDNFAEYLREVGNEVLEIDEENNRILIGEM